MLLNLERVDFLIGQYVSGVLPEPAQVLVGSHLEMQTSSGLLARTLQDLAGEALNRTEPVGLSHPNQRLQAILQSPSPNTDPAQPTLEESEFPAVLRAYTRKDLGAIPWKRKLPGIRQYIIESSADMEASLIWARPGRALPHHSHQGLELTLVLEGEFHDHRGRFKEGEISVADESFDHRPVAGRLGPCLCFSVLFAPIALSGSTLRLFGDLIGI
ncbi:transcriptional regulator [Rhizobium deserti]|uniref:Transcriptional regulator n=1 Tax=Rhizobium deserti TaxID=2547961 RepID=A0A4R5UJ15_9HYPH|nr:cupin domain-containing protein [Rhizobium deserti]TDK36820.1 transcriptional regulator [Rhizobium deserti]